MPFPRGAEEVVTGESGTHALSWHLWRSNATHALFVILKMRMQRSIKVYIEKAMSTAADSYPGRGESLSEGDREWTPLYLHCIVLFIQQYVYDL